MKIASSLEKILAKLENTNHKFRDGDYQEEFNSLKTEVIAMLEEMVELLHNDEDVEVKEGEE